jgi:hypothetical protein
MFIKIYEKEFFMKSMKPLISIVLGGVMMSCGQVSTTASQKGDIQDYKRTALYIHESVDANSHWATKLYVCHGSGGKADFSRKIADGTCLPAFLDPTTGEELVFSRFLIPSKLDQKKNSAIYEMGRFEKLAAPQTKKQSGEVRVAKGLIGFVLAPLPFGAAMLMEAIDGDERVAYQDPFWVAKYDRAAKEREEIGNAIHFFSTDKTLKVVSTLRPIVKLIEETIDVPCKRNPEIEKWIM